MSQQAENGIIERIQQLRERAFVLAPASFLLVRVSLGLMFAQAGWGKLGNLERTAGFFSSLGIPAPGFHAGLVAGVELVGGTALVLGLLSRLVSIPLSITMIVAILTAKLSDVGGIIDLITLDETLYLAVLFALIAVGPGSWSLDHPLSQRVFRHKAKETVPQQGQAAST